MQVQRVQNNNYNTHFGATLKINTEHGKMAKSVIEFLEQQFPKRTKSVKGNIELIVAGYPRNKDLLMYKNENGYSDIIEIHSLNNTQESKESLLDSFVNCLNGFVIREKAQNKINALKKEMIEISDKAYRESKTEFKKSFSVCDEALIENDIAPKDSGLRITAHRNN